MDHSLTADTHFLARHPIFGEEKPYSMRYPPETDIPQSNFMRDKRPLRLANMRQHQDKLNFREVGFGVMSLESEMSYEDFEDDEKLRTIYREEIAIHLKKMLGAAHVLVLDHVVSLIYEC